MFESRAWSQPILLRLTNWILHYCTGVLEHVQAIIVQLLLLLFQTKHIPLPLPTPTLSSYTQWLLLFLPARSARYFTVSTNKNLFSATSVNFQSLPMLSVLRKCLTTFAGEPTFHSQYELNMMETYGTMVQFLLHMHQAKSNKCCQINGSLLGSYFLVKAPV